MRGGVKVVGGPEAEAEGPSGRASVEEVELDDPSDAEDVADGVEVDEEPEHEGTEHEGTEPEGAEHEGTEPTPLPHQGPRSGARGRGQRRLTRAFAVVSVVAVLGVAGTIGFGLAWSGQNASAQAAAAVRTTSQRFLTDLTNFDAKTVDADFAAITGMATGSFAGQARTFFNSAIRQELEDALASSRGQIRSLYIESVSGNQASSYAVVDQLYANNKISAPQSDVLRIVLDLSDTVSGWKVSNVTVLQGPTSTGGTTTPSSPASSTSTPAG
ncbi:MAG: hypothetical protein M0Z95_24910 [Actinomycetota bacterium]|jgi:hypothetical protein|nr:hypothetical protein [Actinomycetota bacterium]